MNGQKPTDDNGSSGAAEDNGPVEVPRLTLGQKFLVALPDLGRKRGANRANDPPTVAEELTETVVKPASTKPRPSRAGKPAPRTAEASDSEDDLDDANRVRRRRPTRGP